MNPVRLLIVTAVDAERDAVGRGLSPAAPVAAPGPPGRELLRLTCNGESPARTPTRCHRPPAAAR